MDPEIFILTPHFLSHSQSFIRPFLLSLRDSSSSSPSSSSSYTSSSPSSSSSTSSSYIDRGVVHFAKTLADESLMLLLRFQWQPDVNK